MKKLTGMMVLGLLLIGFQNCSRVAFDNVGGDLTGKTGFAAGPEIVDVIDKDVIVQDDNAGDDQVVNNNDEVVVDKEIDLGDGSSDDTQDDTTKDDDQVVDNNDGDDSVDDTPGNETPGKETPGNQTPGQVVDNDDQDDQETITEDELDMFACADDSGDSSKKYLVCHMNNGKKGSKTQCLPLAALKAHMDHVKGDHTDHMGACAGDDLASAQ